MKQTDDRGFALLVVLWSLVLITFLTTQILGAGRTALALAGNLRDAAAASARADGAINEAIFHVVASGADHWAADGSPRVIASGDSIVTVRIESLAGQINPNLASTALLTGLFQALGAAPAQAGALATAIIEWRSPAVSSDEAKARLAAYQSAGLPFGPPSRAFADLSALSDVIGMPPALLAKALPHMSLYQSGDPDPMLADVVVHQALSLSGQAGSNSNVFEGNAPVVEIRAEVQGPGELAVRRIATVSITGANGSAPFKILSLMDDSSAAASKTDP